MLKIFNALSIDIAFGAVFSSRLLYYILQLETSFILDVILGLTVWLIYTLDHLIDARSIDGTAQSFRHRLHQSYFTPIFIMWVMLLCLNAFITLIFMASTLLIPGVLLLLFVIVHHLLNRFYQDQYFIFGKEVRIATGYVLGLSLGPIAMAEDLNPILLPAMLCLFCLALINLLFFALMEKSADSQDDLPGIGQFWNKSKISKTIDLLAFICLVSLILLPLLNNQWHVIQSSILLGFMLGIIVFSFRYYQRLKNEEIYRFLGDGIFLLPGLLWL